MEVEEPVTGFRWETDYERTWEAIKESKDGRIQSTIPIEELLQRNKRLRALRKKNLRLGLMRHIFIVIDFSEAMMHNDLKPTRIACTLKLIELFLNEFSSLNPISQVGLIISRNKRYELISPMSSDMKSHIKLLSKIRENPECSGEPSLQNSLGAAMTTLKHMPNHTSKEILVILGSLTTCDPGDINSVIQSLSSFNIRSSVISLSAEVRVCKTLVTATKGTYDVIMDDEHFKNVLFEHLNPPAAIKGTQSSLIRMGFSQYIHYDKETPAMCACHLGTKEVDFSYHGYYCPQCQAKYCNLPIGCYVCGLTLVSAAHLARSFHHLFPVELFQEAFRSQGKCFACGVTFVSEVQEKSSPDDNAPDQIIKNCSKCTLCQNIFCLDCDIFIHESLHFCPGCAK